MSKSKTLKVTGRNRELGQIYHLIYELLFPDGDVWTDCFTYCQDTFSFIKNTKLHLRGPNVARDLLNKGATHWKDNNGVTHRLYISDTEKPRVWGVKRH